MRVTRFAVDGNIFNTIQEARAFRANPDNNYDPEYQIDTILYDSYEKAESGVESVDFSECGTDWQASEWMVEQMTGDYKESIGGQMFFRG